MKYCQKCQLECSEEDVFCSDCGSKLVVSCPLPELADNSPREVLRFLVQKHPDCVKNLDLLKGLLSVDLANAKADRFLLCAVAESGIPERLQKADRLSVSLFGSLSDILTTQCFVPPEMAREGILIWAYALGLKVDDIPLYQPQSMSATQPSSHSSVRKPGHVLTLALPKEKNMEMIWCPPGSFMMGSLSGELGRDDDREAQYQVTLTNGFWIGKYPVTQEQYEAVMGRNPSLYKGVRPGAFNKILALVGGNYSDYHGARRPVEQVNWKEALTFCNNVLLPADGSIPSGYKMTLPTEAQWEYACRAGTTGALNNGLELTSKEGVCKNLAQVGWYINNSNGETHELGQKSPNAWGLYDMHGNVWEWCLDWWDNSYSGAITDPTGPGTGVSHVVRGGSWNYYAKYCRSAYRSSRMPGARSNNLGFRCVLATVQ